MLLLPWEFMYIVHKSVFQSDGTENDPLAKLELLSNQWVFLMNSSLYRHFLLLSCNIKKLERKGVFTFLYAMKLPFCIEYCVESAGNILYAKCSINKIGFGHCPVVYMTLTDCIETNLQR